jgi:hypothetical protein
MAGSVGVGQAELETQRGRDGKRDKQGQLYFQDVPPSVEVPIKICRSISKMSNS